MAGFYDEMQEVATDLLTEFQQGQVSLKRVTTTPGENEWDPPTETSETWPLKAAVRTVSMKYVDGTLIIAGDRQVTFAVPDTTPLLTDLLAIDGKDHAMKDLRALPGAGTVAAWIAFIAA
jgi:hypothetical protein